MTELAEAWRYRDLLFNFVRRDLKIRYKNSVLGFAWSLLNPLFQILVFVLVFRYMIDVGTKNYSAKLFIVMLPWTFFSQALLDGAASVAEQVDLIKKVYFPRLLLPLSTLGSNLVHFGLGMVVLAAYYYLRHVTLAWPHLGLALVGLGIMITFLFGLLLAVSSLCVYYNDVKFMLMSLIQAWFFLSPVLLPADMVMRKLPEKLPAFCKVLYLLNPVAPPLITFSSLLPYDQPGDTNDYLVVISRLEPHFMTYFAISAVTALVTLVAGFVIFRRLQWHFAEQG
jgi:ABC-2 type transport system permease protein